MKKTVIISGFPGIGKSKATELLLSLGYRVSDSDSSKYSWIEKDGEKVRNPNFVNDYLEHIKNCVKDGYDYVFVSTHKEIREALRKAEIQFLIAFPSIRRIAEFRKIYTDRGDVFKDNILNNWTDLIIDIEESCEDHYVKGVVLGHETFLYDVLSDKNIMDLYLSHSNSMLKYKKADSNK